jgi:hypothetical protein
MKHVICFALACILHTVYALEYQETTCDGNKTAIQLTISSTEFFHVYAKTFAMSDGSVIQTDLSQTGSNNPLLQKSFRYIHTLMSDIGIEATHYSANDSHVNFRICNHDLVEIILFAVVGNFVTNPDDTDFSTQSSASNLASLVIDVYTGQLIVVNSYNAIRSLFLEALLVICIIIIARLSFVRTVTQSVTPVTPHHEKRT